MEHISESMNIGYFHHRGTENTEKEGRDEGKGNRTADFADGHGWGREGENKNGEWDLSRKAAKIAKGEREARKDSDRLDG